MASLQAEYKRNGAVCVRGFLSPKWLTKAAEACEAVFQQPSKLVQHKPYRSGSGEVLEDYGNWKSQAALKDVIVNSPIAKVVASLTESKTVTFYHDKICRKDPQDMALAPFHDELSSFPFEGNQVC